MPLKPEIPERPERPERPDPATKLQYNGDSEGAWSKLFCIAI